MNIDKYDFGSPDKIKVGLDHKITNQAYFFKVLRSFSLNIERVIRKFISNEHMYRRSKNIVDG